MIIIFSKMNINRGDLILPKRLTAPQIEQLKSQRSQVWITAYDFTQGQIAEASEMDAILVGDSLGMTVLGYSSTLPVTLADMIHHARVVRRGAPNTFMAVDLPFLTYATPHEALKNAGQLVQECGADAIKIEGGRNLLPIVECLLSQNIPVIGHLGLTPQSVNRMGGYRVQAKSSEAITALVKDAHLLSAVGISALVLEGIPDRVAEFITNAIPIPTIGIGAGPHVDGQVLVYHDALGLSSSYPKFAKPFTRLRELAITGLTQYREETLAGQFPDAAHSYHLSDDEWQRFLDSQ